MPDTDITILSVQRELKPKIEDVLPHYLNGAALDSAMAFAAYLRADKMNLVWAGIHNAWKAIHMGKPILYIRLAIVELWNENRPASFVVTPYLMNMDAYGDEIANAGMQQLIWDGLWRCKVAVSGKKCGNGCSPGVDKIILGKALKNLCNGNFYSGRNWVYFYDPDDMTIEKIKTLLAWEKQARTK